MRQTPGSSLLFRLVLFFAFVAALSGIANAQGDSQPYARRNSFGVLMAYSNDSSHMLLGVSERRKLLNIGVSYSRKLLVTRFGVWTYDGEILPVALESDPLTRSVNVQTSPTNGTVVNDGGPPMATCAPFVNPYNFTLNGITYTGVDTFTCHGRQWTIGEAISPVGLQWNFFPRRKVQPLIEGHGGYMYSTHSIPVGGAGAFNFTFDFGGGIEYFRSRSRSIRVEYRYHHISDHDTSIENPGIDNGVVQLSYVFGR